VKHVYTDVHFTSDIINQTVNQSINQSIESLFLKTKQILR